VNKLLVTAPTRLVPNREENGAARDRLLNGLRKLQETNTLVEGMRGELAALQPVLASKAAATAELLARVDKDQAEAGAVKEVVEKEEADVKRMQVATQVGWRRQAQQRPLQASRPTLLRGCFLRGFSSLAFLQHIQSRACYRAGRVAVWAAAGRLPRTSARPASDPQAMADEARADLEEAMPALEAALDSLKALNKVRPIKSWTMGGVRAARVCVGGWLEKARVPCGVGFAQILAVLNQTVLLLGCERAAESRRCR
jgi:hypothetical protein